MSGEAARGDRKLWVHPEPLCLASASPTRRLLLESAGLFPEIEAAGVDERALEREAAAQRLTPIKLALHLAQAKALAVSRRRGGLVIGADQVLDLDGRVFHKAENVEAARLQLAELAGQTHALQAAVAIAQDGTLLDTFVDSAHLTMRPLTSDEIEAYLALAGEAVLASVGIYQLEGLGVHLFERVEGDHATILGLPLVPLLARLRARGCLAF